MSGRLIALGGKLRAGKDAVGDYLESSHGFVKMGMSDALNEALLALNPWIDIEVTTDHGDTTVTLVSTERYQDLHDRVGYVEAKKNPEVRRLLQVLGTEVGRDMIDQDVWVKIAEKKILDLWSQGRDVVITAIRFPNELDMVRRLGGINAWIERPEALRIDSNGLESSTGTLTPKSKSQVRRMEASTISEHASENSVSADDFNYVLMNDGTLDQLYRKVDKRLVEVDPLPVVDTGHRFYPPYDR